MVTKPQIHIANGDLGGGSSGTGDVVGPAGAVNNDIAVFDATTGKRIKDSGNTIAAVVSAAVTAAEASIIPIALASEVSGVLPTTKLGAGAVVQVVNTQSGAAQTGSTTIPIDDTIPQIGEGDEYYTLAITPKSTTNKLQIDVVLNATASVGGRWIIAALFQDATSNALAASAAFYPTVGGGSPIVFTHSMTSGTTSATTFRLRAGPNAAATTTINGSGAGRLLGGVWISSLTITEIAV